MPFPSKEPNEGALVMIVQILAMLMAFAVPVVALLLIFPARTQAIILVSVYALFAISALFAGVGWSEPNYGPDAKLYTKWIIALTVVAMAASRWYSFPDEDISNWAVGIALRTAILVLPFVFGRFISKQLTKASKPGNK